MDNKTFAIPRPNGNEVGQYYMGYINQVEGNDARDNMQAQYFTTLNFFTEIPQDKWDYSYAEGKWTIKEVVLHLIDAERVFAYRALAASRGDKTPLPGFDQDEYVLSSEANERSPESIIEEYKTVRQASYSLFDNMSEEAIGRIGTASNNPMSARAAVWIILGHEIHHIKVIKEKYL